MSLSPSLSPRSQLSPRSPMSAMSPMSPMSPTSPMSPMSPMSPNSQSSKSPYASFEETHEFKDNENMLDVLTKIGYLNAKQITDTLQGSIYRANVSENGKAGKTVVIKVTDQYLHKHSVSRVINGSTYKVNEDILLEQSILKYLTQHDDAPDSFVRFQRFFQTNTDYFLVMEDGGSSLYHFAIKAHRLIKAGRIEISHWKKVVKIILKQLVECVAFLHSKNVVHFDVSLENILINDVEIQIKQTKNKNKNKNKKTKTKETVCFVLEDIRIKLCDFGMAQLYSNSECMSSKFRGKTNYKSPEVISKKRAFDAKSNDIWCIAVCLFMIAVGFPPFNSAHKDDAAFQYIMKGELLELLKSWKVLKYFDKYLFSLIDSSFQYEKYRITMSEIQQHPYIQND